MQEFAVIDGETFVKMYAVCIKDELHESSNMHQVPEWAFDELERAISEIKEGDENSVPEDYLAVHEVFIRQTPFKLEK